MVRKYSRYSRKLRNTRRLVKGKRHTKKPRIHRRKPTKQNKRKYTRKYKNVVIHPSKKYTRATKTSKKSTRKSTRRYNRLRGGDMDNTFNQQRTPFTELRKTQLQGEEEEPQGLTQKQPIEMSQGQRQEQMLGQTLGQKQKELSDKMVNLTPEKVKKTGLQHIREGAKKNIQKAQNYLAGLYNKLFSN